MRKTFLSLFAVLLAAFAALTVTVGIASAGTGKHCDDNGVAKTNANCNNGVAINAPVTVGTDPAPTTTPAPPACVDRDPRLPGCQAVPPRGFPGPFPGRPGVPAGGHFNDRFNGHFVVLDGGPQLDVCATPDYPAFVGRYGTYRNRFDQMFGPNPAARFVQLHNSDCGTNTVVTNDGDCTTVTTAYQQYNTWARNWNSVVNRTRGLHVIAGPLRVELDNARTQRDHWRDVYNHDNNVRLQQHTTCTAPTTITNIVVEPAPASYVVPAAPATVTEQAPAPVVAAPSTPQIVTVPKGSAETGDGSTDLH